MLGTGIVAYPRDGRWRVRVSIEGERISLGYFVVTLAARLLA